MRSLERLKQTIRRRVYYERRVRFGGAHFAAPVVRGLAVTDHEPWMARLLSRLLPRFPGVFVDVGVNLGQTLLAAKGVDPGRRYIGFEPNGDCVHYVLELVRANGLAGVTVYPVAIGARNAALELRFFADDAQGLSASVVDGFRPRSPVAETRGVVGIAPAGVDGLFPDPVGVVKIDVEGAELEVLEGVDFLVARDRPAILVEILPAYSDTSPRIARDRAIEAFCKRHGYTISVVDDKDGDVVLRRLDGIPVHSDLGACDYCLAPGERDV